MWSQRHGSESVATQVKGLSPEILVASGQVVHSTEANNEACGRGGAGGYLPGSETATGSQRVTSGTWEGHAAPAEGSSLQAAKEVRREYGGMVGGSACSRGVAGVATGEGGDPLEEADDQTREQDSRPPRSEVGNGTAGKLVRIAAHARQEPQMKFTSLAYLLNEEFLAACYRQIKHESVGGIDGVKYEEYGERLTENLQGVVERMKHKAYHPSAVKRVYIPKEGNKTRALGLPTIEGKVVQKGMTKIMEAIYEADFLDCSYGSRPGRSCHQALKEVNRLVMSCPINHLIEADITGFFDNVSQEWLVKMIRERITDRSFLELIERHLKAGYEEEGQWHETEMGTPQGGNLSPMLANIFLHYVLDLWFEKKIKSRLQGQGYMIRYVDDYVCLFQKQEDAQWAMTEMRERFAKFGLKLNAEKTRVISFGRYENQNAEQQGRKANTFDFLGFTHYCGKNRNGKFMVKHRTCAKKFRAKYRKMNQWLKAVRNSMETKEWWKMLGSKLTGHYRYYGISGNYQSINRFYRRTKELIRKWLNRRSQCKTFSMVNYWRYLEKYPLPTPRIFHNFYPLTNMP